MIADDSKKGGFVTRFTAPYERGELVAIGHRDGRPVSRSEFRSAEPELSLHLTAEAGELRTDGADLASVSIEIAHKRGTVEMLAESPSASKYRGLRC